MQNTETHLKSSAFITDIVIGMSDGLTVPFALAAGLSGAVQSNSIVITAGIAEIVAGSIAMGLGGYLAGKTEQEHYATEQKREYEEVVDKPEVEKQEVREALAGFGLSKNAQDVVADELAKDKDQWVRFMMKYELCLEEPDVNRARNSAANIGISYIVGGLIPLSGYFKTKVTGQSPFKGAFKVTAIGIAAAGAAFIVAKTFNHLF